jgi:hypothetical protein
MHHLRAWLVVSFLLVVAGCEDGGGGRAVRLYFGMENSDTCSKLDVTVDLESAAAQVGRLGNGSLDCLLSAALSSQGCEASFTESSDGRGLRVEITECEDVWEGMFFECGFDRVDLSRINASIGASCDCAHEAVCRLNGSTCYRRPGICATEDPSGDGCENCNNDADDDGDGEIDCRDPKCFYDCGVGLTTVTCTTSSLPTTTHYSTTITFGDVEDVHPDAVLYGPGGP